MHANAASAKLIIYRDAHYGRPLLTSNANFTIHVSLFIAQYAPIYSQHKKHLAAGAHLLILEEFSNHKAAIQMHLAATQIDHVKHAQLMLDQNNHIKNLSTGILQF